MTIGARITRDGEVPKYGGKSELHAVADPNDTFTIDHRGSRDAAWPELINRIILMPEVGPLRNWLILYKASSVATNLQ